MYGADFATTVHVDGPALGFEGAERPGHFDGVATVVAKLLVQSQADVAYFGRKDAQQAAVIRRLVRDLDIPVRVEVLPTIREYDGLAVSSRNAYLTPEQRAAAPALFLALSAMRDRFHSGVQDAQELVGGVRALLAREPLMASVEYVAVVDPETFAAWSGGGACLLIAAVRMGDVRLIDNVVLD
jgi:pantoate--beta-alanine ligase